MKHLKKLAMTIVGLWCCMAASAFFVDGGFYYNILSETDLTVVVIKGPSTGDVSIPSTVAYNGQTYSVTSIASKAFSGSKGLTSITIPEGVTSIGSEAFFGCTGLTSITIPESVTIMGESAFYNCKGLTSVTILEGVTSVGHQAFYGCTGLTSVTIPGSVTSMGESAFSYCTGLTSVTILEGVTSVGHQAFYGCTGLTSVTIPGSVTSIGSSAFSGCIGLTSVTIPGSVTSIGSSAFSGCTGLTSITILEGVTSIGEYAFSDCTGLTSITIPESVKSIGSGAFYGCTGLTSVSIPGSVTSIGKYAFDGCKSLTSVHISDIAAWCKIDFEDNRSNPLYYAKHLYMNGKEITELIIPDGVTSIGVCAFYGCSSLTEITCKAITPPTCGTDVFKGVDKSIPLYVPKGSVIKYKAADVWRDFVIIREIAEAGSDVYLTINDGSEGNIKLKVNDAQPYFTLKIEPEAGWQIHSVTFNDGDVTAELSADGEYVTPVIGTDSQLGIVYAQGSSSINSVSDSKIRVWASDNSVIVEGAEFGKTINVYTIDGIMSASVNADSDRVVIPLQSGYVYIVKIGEQTLKVAL